MHFLEDALENIEGLPEEVKSRCEQIRLLDRDVERLQLEKQMMEKQLWGSEGSKDEKQEMCIEIMEKFAKMRELAGKKVVMSQKLALLLRRLSEKTKEQQEFFKCELEVDDAGCTGPIERRFIHQLEMIRSGRLYTCDSDESSRCSPVEGIVPCNNNITEPPKFPLFKERNGKGRPPKNSYYTEDGRKYKRKGKDAPLSAYMRKKKERLREQQKMLEVHARRDEERRRNEVSKSSAQVPQIDLASFCAQAGGTSAEPSRDPSATPSGDQDDAMSWTGGMADMIGSDDDDFDPLEALDLFPSMLPSPPREIMESLGEDSLFGLDDDMTSGLGGSSDSRSPMYPPSFDPMASGPSSPIKMPPPQSFGLDTPGLDKRKKITFGSTSDTSIHGRPRKLTDRAFEAVQQTNEKLKKREEVVQHQMSLLQTQQQQSQEDKEKWCFCRQGSYGTMVGCDSDSCRYEWFHLDCLHMLEAPTGDWYCPDCRERREQEKRTRQ